VKGRHEHLPWDFIDMEARAGKNTRKNTAKKDALPDDAISHASSHALSYKERLWQRWQSALHEVGGE